MPSDEFRWSPLVGAGHRSLQTETSSLRKAFKSINIFWKDGKSEDLLESQNIHEFDKLVIITGVVGIFSGARYDMHQGFIQSAAKNGSDWIDENSNLKLDKYQNAYISVVWAQGNTNTISIQHLMDIVFLLAHVSLEEMPTEDNSQKDETESIVTLTPEEIQKRIREQRMGAK